MNIRHTFAVAVVVTGAVVACTSGTGSTGGPSDSSGFITQFCDLFTPCCQKAGKPTDGATCRAFYTAFTGASQYDAQKGGDCLAEVRAQQSSPTYCEGLNGASPSCKKVFKEASTGSALPGADCTKDSDCASSLEGEVNCASSYGSGGAESKACQVEIEGKEGDMPCVGTRSGSTTIGGSSFGSGDAGPPRPPAKGYVCDVAKGVYCDSKTTACAKVSDVGGACETSNSYACVKTAICDFATKKCIDRLAVGADCSKNSGACADKSSCDSTTKKCVAGLADGAACTSGSQCESDRCVNSKCGDTGSDDLSVQLLCGK